MKKILSICLTALAIGAYGQSDNVGIGTTNPDNSAILDLSSSNKGFLLPRMTKDQRLNIKNPAQGLQVFQTNEESGLYVYDGTEWTTSANSIVAATDPWVFGGNVISSGDFIGSTNNVPLILKSNNVKVAELSSGNNVFVGYLAGNSITTGSSNTSIGYGALRDNTVGTGNLAIGVNSMRGNISGNFNAGLGRNALLANTTGSYNSAVGNAALASNTTGSSNTAFGSDALTLNTTGGVNLALGGASLRNNIGGSLNIGIGWSSLSSNVSGNGNLAIGAYALNQVTTGSNNTAIGYEAGRANTGTNNIFIGYNAGKNETGSNKLYFANSDTQTPLIYGDFSAKYVTIGDVTPAQRTQGTSNSGGYNLLVKGGILTEKVKVALASSADWADYVFEENYNLMALNEVEAFVKENKHLPNIPSAEEMVAEGLNVSEINKLMMEKIEELTLYVIQLQKDLEALRK